MRSQRPDAAVAVHWSRTLPAVLALACVSLLTATSAALAQSASPREARGPWTLAFYVGGSTHSPVGHHWGLTPNRRHMQLGLHATVPIVRRPRWSFRYAPEITPLLIVTNNPTYGRAMSETGLPVVIEGPARPVAGIGFAPIGFEGQQRLAGRVHTYQTGALGALWFTRQAPVLGSRAFNFTFEFGGGFLWPLAGRVALRTGYKFHHFSNAKTAQQNPGVDAKMFFVGLERTYGRLP